MNAGREMDALVAEKVMGWEKRQQPDRKGPNWGWWWGVEGDTSSWAISTWSPSTDIAAAWEVLRKLQDKGWLILHWEIHDEEDHMVWHIQGHALGHKVEVSATELPHAICLAALKAVDA